MKKKSERPNIRHGFHDPLTFCSDYNLIGPLIIFDDWVTLGDLKAMFKSQNQRFADLRRIHSVKMGIQDS